jgi:hypothetical protein
MTVDPGSGAPMADRMQSLLSQAVEDQRAEQRQLAVALMDVRGQLNRVVTELEALRAAPAGEGGGGGGGGAQEAVATISRDLREAVRMLAERLDAVGRSVQERGADLAEIKVAVADLHSAVRGHTNALAGVNQALAAVPAVGERVGGLQDNLVSLHDRLAGLEEVVAAVDRLGLRIESADQDLRELRSAFTGMASRMAELPSRTDLGAATTQSTESLDVVAGRLSRIESAMPELLSRIDAVREHAATAPAAEGTTAPARAGLAGEEVVARLDAVEAALVVLTEQLQAEPEPLDGEDEDETADSVADQLAELTEVLFGEGGLVARLDDASVDEESLDRRISTAVQTAVADSEQRLSAHMDEAVLALAEALFRTSRRPGRTPAPTAVAVPAAPAPPVAHSVAIPVAPPDAEPKPEPAGETDEADEPDEASDDEPADDEPVDEEPVDETTVEDELEAKLPDESQPAAPSAMSGAAWQVPAGAVVDVPEPAEEAKPGRRRPWWRPGD